MAFINHDLHVKRRSDLENQNVESLWLEICPFKSKRSIIVGSIYRPPSSNNANDIDIESNIEGVYLQNKETIIVSDINIDYINKSSYNKHKLAKGLRSMHFKRLYYTPTLLHATSCLDYVYCNQPMRIKNISTHNIGISDHLPIFIVRMYARENVDRNNNGLYIKYRNMKCM